MNFDILLTCLYFYCTIFYYFSQSVKWSFVQELSTLNLRPDIVVQRLRDLFSQCGPYPFETSAQCKTGRYRSMKTLPDIVSELMQIFCYITSK